MRRQTRTETAVPPTGEPTTGRARGGLGQRGRGKRGPWLRMTHQHRPISCDTGDSELRCDPQGPQTDPQTRHKPNTALKQSLNRLFKKQPPPRLAVPPRAPLPLHGARWAHSCPGPLHPQPSTRPAPRPPPQSQQAPVPGTQRHQPGARLLLDVRVHDPQSRAGRTGDALVSQRERRSPS